MAGAGSCCRCDCSSRTPGRKEQGEQEPERAAPRRAGPARSAAVAVQPQEVLGPRRGSRRGTRTCAAAGRVVAAAATPGPARARGDAAAAGARATARAVGLFDEAAASDAGAALATFDARGAFQFVIGHAGTAG